MCRGEKLLLSFFRVKEQNNATAKRSETNMLFWHICHLRALRRGSLVATVCNGVINCSCLCTSVWWFWGRYTAYADFQRLLLDGECGFCNVQVIFPEPGVLLWDRWVPAGLPGPDRFSYTPQAAEELERSFNFPCLWTPSEWLPQDQPAVGLLLASNSVATRAAGSVECRGTHSQALA